MYFPITPTQHDEPAEGSSPPTEWPSPRLLTRQGVVVSSATALASAEAIAVFFWDPVLLACEDAARALAELQAAVNTSSDRFAVICCDASAAGSPEEDTAAVHPNDRFWSVVDASAVARLREHVGARTVLTVPSLSFLTPGGEVINRAALEAVRAGLVTAESFPIGWRQQCYRARVRGSARAGIRLHPVALSREGLFPGDVVALQTLVRGNHSAGMCYP